MLTADLSINFKRGQKIYPFLIKTDGAEYLTDAENLIAIFEGAAGRTRGEIEAEIDEYVGTGTEYRMLRGLVKLLNDRAEFETEAPAEPFEIRQKVFLEARKFQPVLPASEIREEVLQFAADEFKSDKATIFSNLYADLSAQQRLTKFETLTPRDLLERYNLAQAQAILYKCVEMKIRVAPSDAANYRAIFDWIKHFGLIYSIAGNSENGYEITLTGAASLFHRSQKYGIQMSVFLPALLLCKNWEMRAEINDKKGTAFYELTSEQTDLTSCYFNEPEYKNPDIEKLKKNFEKLNNGWKIKENNKVIDLGKTAFIPDSVLTSPDKKEIYLEVLGFWTPKSLQKRLAEFEAANYKNFILCASNELRGSREEFFGTSENLILYKTKIEPLLLIETAENY